MSRTVWILRPSIIKAMTKAGFDLNFVFRRPWLAVWCLIFLVVLPVMSHFKLISNDFCIGAYLSIIPTLLFTQKLFFLKLAHRK